MHLEVFTIAFRRQSVSSISIIILGSSIGKYLPHRLHIQPPPTSEELTNLLIFKVHWDVSQGLKYWNLCFTIYRVMYPLPFVVVPLWNTKFLTGVV